jgi:hypothetical protein
MLCNHFLQQCFNLSDPAMDEALCDAPMFRESGGLDMGEDNLPEESTIFSFSLLDREAPGEFSFADAEQAQALDKNGPMGAVRTTCAPGRCSWQACDSAATHDPTRTCSLGTGGPPWLRTLAYSCVQGARFGACVRPSGRMGALRCRALSQKGECSPHHLSRRVRRRLLNVARQPRRSSRAGLIRSARSASPSLDRIAR